jgi:hypothetical protein
VRRGRLAAIFVIVVLLGAVTQARATAPKKPTVAQQLNAYLKAMHTAASRLTNDADNITEAGSQWDGDEKIIDNAGTGFAAEVTYKLTAPALMRDEAAYEKAVQAAQTDAQHQAPVLAHVKAPTAMRGPHALLAAAAKKYIVQLGKAIGEIQSAPAIDPVYDNAAGPLSVTQVGIAMTDGELAAAAYQGIAKNWRQELIVQLRHAQITVPLWVKEVGGV